MSELATVIAKAQEYCAEAPDIVPGEGYWDDMETAYGCGMWQQQGEAAHLIRRLLKALGYDAPEGLETCDECDANLTQSDHAEDCTHFGEEESSE